MQSQITHMKHHDHKQQLTAFRSALYDGNLSALRAAAESLFAENAVIKLSHPIGTLPSATHWIDDVFGGLTKAIPDLERRDLIVIGGTSEIGADWVGCCGYYTGTFSSSWMDIPPTGHMASLRFHEFFRFEDGKVTEVQAIWDIPELMMQAGAWPLSPSLGREWLVPGPAKQDGLRLQMDDDQSNKSLELVRDMCNALGNYAEGGVEAMALDRYWHPHCSWYGPSGIGTGRGISGFRRWHQIPFLNGLPDRVGNVGEGHLFAEGDFVGFTAWPGMHMTVSGDGWLGIAPAGQKIEMRSLDFWRCSGGMIRENWVLVDLLDVYRQLNVDVFARMREMTGQGPRF